MDIIYNEKDFSHQVEFVSQKWIKMRSGKSDKCENAVEQVSVVNSVFYFLRLSLTHKHTCPSSCFLLLHAHWLHLKHSDWSAGRMRAGLRTHAQTAQTEDLRLTSCFALKHGCKDSSLHLKETHNSVDYLQNVRLRDFWGRQWHNSKQVICIQSLPISLSVDISSWLDLSLQLLGRLTVHCTQLSTLIETHSVF